MVNDSSKHSSVEQMAATAAKVLACLIAIAGPLIFLGTALHRLETVELQLKDLKSALELIRGRESSPEHRLPYCPGPEAAPAR